MWNYTIADEDKGILDWLSHLTPRHATTTFEPVGSTEWETGSYKPKNIRIGLVGLIVQPYFVMEVRGLESPILGKREDT